MSLSTEARAALCDEIRQSGLRATRSRVEVLALLRSERRPLTHGDVVALLGEAGCDRATLYRNLMDLSGVGLAKRVALGPSFRFERMDASGDHAHFVCTRCGDVRCTPQVRLPEPSDSMPRAVMRGQVEVQLHGVCDDCG